MELTQIEADALLALPKRISGGRVIRMPKPGQKERLDVESLDGREQFYLDMSRSRIKLTKRTHQTRARRTEILARMCLDGAPHGNPDGSRVGRDHLHIYREGYADKWAYDVPPDAFGDLSDLWQTLKDFLRYCSIAAPVGGEPVLAFQ